jgi:lysyl-tRNA synthetase class 2
MTHDQTKEMLRARANLLQVVRQFFDQRNFVEVQTPILSQDIVVDRYLEPLSIPGEQLSIPRARGQTFWLQTSPEFAMKRLLATGVEAIYQISHAFRAGEAGRLHNPEFIMLEWYRCGDDLQAGMNLLREFTCAVFGQPNCQLTSYREVFQQHALIEPLAAAVNDFRQRAMELNLDVTSLEAIDDLDVWRNFFLANVVEPRLGYPVPQIVFDWPASQAALARIRQDDPPVAERFELYYRGVELANGYHELLDADELLRRNRATNRNRELDGRRQLPDESRLLQTMRTGLPACCGVAVGFDRLLMVATGKHDLREVIPFPIEIA